MAAPRPALTRDEVHELFDRYGRFMPLTAVMTETGLPESTLRRLVAEGQLKRYRPGGARAYRYKTIDIAHLMREA